MSWISDKINKFVLSKGIKRLAQFLTGKKTAIGAVSLLLWVVIYAMPAFTPDYNYIVEYAKMIRDGLIASGLNLDNELFNAGVGFTLLGLVDKIRRFFKKEKDNG